MKKSILYLFLLLNFNVFGVDTLFINRDTLTITPVFFQKCSFNTSSVFNIKNAVIDIPLGEEKEFIVFNNDITNHEVNIPNTSGNEIIAPDEAVLIVISNLDYGTHLMYIESSVGNFLGAGVTIRVGVEGKKYAWDLWDQDPELTEGFGNGTYSSLPEVYRPRLFTINGGVEPMEMSSEAMVMGNVGDTIVISIVNTGNMIHPLHFHGYHVEIIQATIQTETVGWSKDSFPVMVKEAMTIRLVPHQPGEFPVHNHNLIATLFNNGYPKGMVTMLMIEE